MGERAGNFALMNSEPAVVVDRPVVIYIRVSASTGDRGTLLTVKQILPSTFRAAFPL